MTITNGYATLAEFKAWAKITSTDATDDTVIEAIIEGVSREIDRMTQKTFYARAGEARLFSLPDWRTDNEVRFDDWLCSITTLQNGDGSTIASSEYVLLPTNFSPKYALRLKDSTSISWLTNSSGSSENVISITGAWGYSQTIPAEIHEACLMGAEDDYHQRFGENTSAVATITGAGVVLSPQGLSKRAYEKLRAYLPLT